MKIKKIYFYLSLLCLFFYLEKINGETKESLNTKSCNWVNDNTLTLLDNSVIHECSVSKKLPASIGFFTADIKYDGTDIKFCEIGNGVYGVVLPAYSFVNNKKELMFTPYWDLFWLYIKQFNIPIWWIGGFEHNRGITIFHQCNGTYFRSVNSFEQYVNQCYPECKNKISSQNIKDYKGIIFYAGERNSKIIDRIRRIFPGAILVNNIKSLFKRRKDEIHAFFKCDELKSFRPSWGVYPKSYSPDLTKKIVKDISSEYFVIKPLIGQRATGVLMTDKKSLDSLLKIILKDYIYISQDDIPGLTYWKHDINKSFVIEEYVQSKPYFVRNNWYDPTLRLVFFAHCSEGKVYTNFVSAFWKIPPAPINNNISDIKLLTSQHITQSMIGSTTPGYPVAQEDMDNIRSIMNKILPEIYEQMIAHVD